MTPEDVRFFDGRDDYSVVWKDLPHRMQAGTLAFVTWRTADSMPEKVLLEWNRVRDEVLLANGFDPKSNWKQQLGKLDAMNRGRIRWLLFSEWDLRLDNSAGECVLADGQYSEIVMNSLRHFDGDRYLLTDAVIMPNHVHLIAAFQSETALLTQCTSWKHFTATAIHRRQRLMASNVEFPAVAPPLRRPESPKVPLPLLTAGGPSETQPAERLANCNYKKQCFWQPEQFDHLVRSEPQFQYFREYIANNPRRAGLKQGSYRHYSRTL